MSANNMFKMVSASAGSFEVFFFRESRGFERSAALYMECGTRRNFEHGKKHLHLSKVEN
jgi:hypothetical protein